MFFKNFLIFFMFFFIFSGCQTIKEKSDSIAEKENREYGKLVGKNVTELKNNSPRLIKKETSELLVVDLMQVQKQRTILII